MVNGKIAHCLLDTGSLYSIVNEQFAKSLNVEFKPLREDHPRKLFVANGRVLFVNNYVEFILKIEKDEFLCEALVATELSVSSEIVIGVTFLKKYKAVIDFNTNVLSLIDSLTTDITVIPDDHDILSLTDLTKLDPHSMTSVRVKVPNRFNGKLIQVTPLRAIKNNSVLLEHSINKPAHGTTHILLTNTTNDRIFLPKFMRVAACEIIPNEHILSLSDLKTDTPFKLIDPINHENIVDFHDTVYETLPRPSPDGPRDSQHTQLDARAPPFVPRVNVINETEDSGTKAPPVDKLAALSALGLDLSKCNITAEEKSRLVEVLFEYKEVFDTDSFPEKPIPGFQYKIDLIDNEPVFRKQYRNRIDVTEQIEEHVAKLLKDGILEKSFSAYNSPLLLIRKPGGGTRICLDCRALNLKIKPSFNYLHDLEHTIQKIQSYNGKVFSTLDIKNAFYAIELHPDSRHITNFTVPSGAYRYKRLIQGMNTSPAVFCQIINTIFNDKNNNLAIYLDDLILANKTFDSHLENLRTVLQRALSNNLRINGHKCKLFAERVPFLGKVLSAEGCHVSEDKIKALRTLEPPKNVKELRRFMGACGYVRRHIPNYSHLVSPLTRLLRKDAPYEFDSSCQDAFERLKKAFESPAVLRNFTPGKDVYLFVDASTTAIASVLFQKDEKTKKLYIIDTFGKMVDKHQKFYTISELELLAIVSSLSAYRQYLTVTTNIFVKSDHISLTFWRTIKNHPVGRINRWAQILSQYSIHLDWIRGKDNHIADLLSRTNYTDETSSKLNNDDEQELNETVMVLQNELTHDTLNSSCYRRVLKPQI